MRKITKPQARKLYDSGKSIYLNSSKMRLNSMWSSPMKVSKRSTSGRKFEALVNEFKYYNCSRETGLAVHFYKD